MEKDKTVPREAICFQSSRRPCPCSHPLSLKGDRFVNRLPCMRVMSPFDVWSSCVIPNPSLCLLLSSGHPAVDLAPVQLEHCHYARHLTRTPWTFTLAFAPPLSSLDAHDINWVCPSVFNGWTTTLLPLVPSPLQSLACTYKTRSSHALLTPLRAPSH